MNGNCLDIGTIQAFLDGETRPEDAIWISDHVADCDNCTLLLAQAEEESSLVFSVLDREMNTLVPTQRLWNRINAEIAEEKSHASVWQRFLGAISASLLSPSLAGAAGLLLLLGMVSIAFLDQSGSAPTDMAKGVEAPPSAIVASSPADQNEVHVATTTSDPVLPIQAGSSKPMVAKSELSDRELKRMVQYTKLVESGPRKTTSTPISAPQYLPGEESYIRTISQLEQNIGPQNASMRASSQVSHQRDIAIVEDSIRKMREVVKKDPRNQAARQILYSSYQDKIDLLKSSAQRDELMASLR